MGILVIPRVPVLPLVEMENNMNKVFLRGYVANEPRTRFSERGSRYVSFILATLENPSGCEEIRTSFIQWLKIIAWGQVALTAERMLYKGCQINIEGRLYKSRNECLDGTFKSQSEIILDQFELDIRDWRKTGIRA